jgi:hypothetical protein
MGILSGLLALGLGLVVSAGYTLMVEDGAGWREMAESQRQRRLHVSPKRGAIYDRNGSALAVSVEVPSVSLDAVELLRGVPPGQVPLVAREAANRIAGVLQLDAAHVERRILQKRRFAWLKRQISAEEAEKVRALANEGPAAQRLRGLVVEGEGRRYYPRRELGGPLLGFVAPDGEGKDGLEYALNEDLKGRVDKLSGLRDRSGRLIFADGVEDERALAGHNVYLTRGGGRLGGGGRSEQRRNPGACQLAAVQPQRLPRRRAAGTQGARGQRLVRAGVDGQDVHRGGRAGRRRDHAHAETLLRKRLDAGRQRGDPRHASGRVAHHLADPGGVFEHLLCQDWSEPG